MSASPQPVADVLADLGRGLAALGVRWFLFGAQAAILHGAARLSADVDVTVDLGARSTRELVAVLTQEEFELRVAAAGFAETTRILPLVHVASRMPPDVVLAGPGLEEQFFVRVPVVSAEDLVAMKSWPASDVEDVTAVIRARGDLDLDCTRSTLRLLERALDRADLVAELDASSPAPGPTRAASLDDPARLSVVLTPGVFERVGVSNFRISQPCDEVRRPSRRGALS